MSSRLDEANKTAEIVHTLGRRVSAIVMAACTGLVSLYWNAQSTRVGMPYDCSGRGVLPHQNVRETH